MAYYAQGGDYPRQNMYTDPHRPYADPPSPAGPEDYASPEQYFHATPYAAPGQQGGGYYDHGDNGGGYYSAGDFVSPERDGRGVPGGRQPTYPPASSDPDLLDKEDAFAYEKPSVPVTRGSIAAQVRTLGRGSIDAPATDTRSRPTSLRPRVRSRKRRGCACSARTSMPAHSLAEAACGVAAASFAAASCSSSSS